MNKSTLAPQKRESRFKKAFNLFRRKQDVVVRLEPKGRFGRQFIRRLVCQGTSYQWGSMFKQSRDFSYPESVDGFPQRNRNYRRSKYNGKGELI